MPVTADMLLYRPPMVGQGLTTDVWHGDLCSGEHLVQLASRQAVSRGLAVMAQALRKYYAEKPDPVCVLLRRGGSWIMGQLRLVDSETFGNIQPMRIHSTLGQDRLPELQILHAPDPKLLANAHVLLVDGVADTQKTLAKAAEYLVYQAQTAGCAPPLDIKACVGVIKDGAAQVEAPLLAAALAAGPNAWLVGMSDDERDGFDCDDRFRRGLPMICELVTTSAGA